MRPTFLYLAQTFAQLLIFEKSNSLIYICMKVQVILGTYMPKWNLNKNLHFRPLIPNIT